MGFQYSNLMQFGSLTSQQKILIDGFNGLGSVVLSLISKSPRSRFMLELMLLLCRFFSFETLCSISASSPVQWWFRQYCSSFVISSEDRPLIGSVGILDAILCSGSLVWLFSPAWDAVKLILAGCWLHLSIRGHWPCRFRSDNCSCSELAPGLMFDNFLTIPDAESMPFYPLVLKLVVCPDSAATGDRLAQSTWTTMTRQCHPGASYLESPVGFRRLLASLLPGVAPEAVACCKFKAHNFTWFTTLSLLNFWYACFLWV